MISVSQPFWVVAVPNDNGRSLEQFRMELETGLASSIHLKYVSIHEVTQLVDNDDDSAMGDCFVVEFLWRWKDISVSTDEDGTETNDSTHVLPNSNVIIELLFPDSRAEVWVDGQGSIPLAPPYGWKQETFLCQSSNVDSIQTTLRTLGLVFVTRRSTELGQGEEATSETHGLQLVYQNVLTQLRAHIAILEDTVRRNHPNIHLGESAFGFREYTHRGIERFEVLFDPTSSPLYEMLRDGLEPQWVDQVCTYLNRDRSRIRLGISCVYSRPGATDQDWHTDGDHRSPPIQDPYHHHPHHQPYALCVFVPLIPLTAETGFTRFWPKSHQYPNLLGLALAADALQATVDGVNLQPGDYVLYDYTTWHKGVGNTSNLERPVVQFLYSADWYEERKNYGTQSVFDAS